MKLFKKKELTYEEMIKQSVIYSWIAIVISVITIILKIVRLLLQ